MKFLLLFTFSLLLFLSCCAPTIKETATTKTYTDYVVVENVTTSSDGKVVTTKRYIPKPTFGGTFLESLIRSMLPLTDSDASAVGGK
jgi:hypothetical protein